MFSIISPYHTLALCQPVNLFSRPPCCYKKSSQPKGRPADWTCNAGMWDHEADHLPRGYTVSSIAVTFLISVSACVIYEIPSFNSCTYIGLCLCHLWIPRLIPVTLASFMFPCKGWWLLYISLAWASLSSSSSAYSSPIGTLARNQPMLSLPICCYLLQFLYILPYYNSNSSNPSRGSGQVLTFAEDILLHNIESDRHFL